ncbi:hypothetical protein [Streptomyces fagopyri]|uniref:hypothetical protein n=1 Tax=Streptomyces fagopyri TaxID=2662397 RepID=UPI003817DE22
MTTGNPAELERSALEAEFWQKIDRSGGDPVCRLWTAASRHEFRYPRGCASASTFQAEARQTEGAVDEWR